MKSVLTTKPWANFVKGTKYSWKIKTLQIILTGKENTEKNAKRIINSRQGEMEGCGAVAMFQRLWYLEYNNNNNIFPLKNRRFTPEDVDSYL